MCFMQKKIFTEVADIAAGICSFNHQLQSTFLNKGSARAGFTPNILDELKSASVSVGVWSLGVVSTHTVRLIRSLETEHSQERFRSPGVSTPTDVFCCPKDRGVYSLCAFLLTKDNQLCFFVLLTLIKRKARLVRVRLVISALL